MAGFVAMALAIGLSRCTPLFLGRAVDALQDDPGGGRVLVQLALMLATALAGGICLYYQRWLLIGTSRRVERDLRTDLFHRVQRLDPADLESRSTGDLMSRFTNDLAALRDVAGPGLMYSFQMTGIVTVTVGFLISIDPMLTLVAVLPYPLVSLVTYFYGRGMHNRSRQVQESFGHLSSRAQEDLSGTRVIRAYGQEQAMAARFHRQCLDYQEANLALARLRAGFYATITSLAALGPVITLLVGGAMVMAGTLSLGGFTSFTVYLIGLTWPVAAIGWVVSILQRGASAMGRWRQVMDLPNRIVSGPDRSPARPRLEFRGVDFTYPGASRPALQEISFTIEPGMTLGVVGRTGSGKSTLLRLLLRFHDPTAGRILLDGVDLRRRSLESLRALVGYAPQEAFLFSRTLAENLSYSRPGMATTGILAACRVAGLTRDLDRLPAGLDTVVGERGITLSGGQRQRASLARALVADPKLLLLDDTLSSVDAHKEEEILAALRPVLAERTTVIVTHRLSAVRRADLILVLDRGRIVERGRHADLAARNGVYASLLSRQKLRDRMEDHR